MASTFKYRGGWRAQAFDRTGQRLTRDFNHQSDARQWAAEVEAADLAAHAPELGGPTQATLADMLAHYARLYTIRKGGCVQELNRINQYLAAAGRPLLRLRKAAEGAKDIVEVSQAEVDASVSTFLRKHLDTRRERNARTRQRIAELAKLRVSRITRADIDRLMADMDADGASASTIQKHVALLKHAFNQAIGRWNWGHLTNPCVGVKLGRSRVRLVIVTKAQMEALYRALAETDNIYFWPLVDAAIFLTARKSSLLGMTWDQVDLKNRFARFDSKTGPTTVPLAARMVEVLSALPRHPSGRVFPMTDNAVQCAWEKVRAKAGLPTMQFRDLRHIGGTYWAKLCINSHVIKNILGHKTTYMADVYVNLACSDLVNTMDQAEAMHRPDVPVPPSRAKRMSAKARVMLEALAEERRKEADSGLTSAGAKVYVLPVRRDEREDDERRERRTTAK